MDQQIWEIKFQKRVIESFFVIFLILLGLYFVKMLTCVAGYASQSLLRHDHIQFDQSGKFLAAYLVGLVAGML
ncbi:MAG: hypothetical protein CENE_02457 [Candidatus Celerinatantimonas neptuna]|nr:MAG: hypothetical protein CENE_02457 [Candidatus Celerinatantimonas neptuna]